MVRLKPRHLFLAGVRQEKEETSGVNYYALLLFYFSPHSFRWLLGNTRKIYDPFPYLNNICYTILSFILGGSTQLD
jgi:hypothetical protein